MAKHRKTPLDRELEALRVSADPTVQARMVRVDRILDRGRGPLLARAHKHRVQREREAKKALTTRIGRLKASLPKGWQVCTWSPGDGVTRYRFFHNAPRNQPYFGPADGVRTVLGMGAAEEVAQNIQISGNAWVR